jgi:hypothetical protein
MFIKQFVRNSKYIFYYNKFEIKELIYETKNSV